MSGKATSGFGARASTRRLRRGNPGLEEHEHDPYRDEVKVRTPVRCGGCGAVFRAGRWVWDPRNRAAPGKLLCPACRRERDAYPAGEITLRGTFLGEHVDEALRMVKHIEAAENAEHPLHRIMTIDQTANQVVIRTTDIHLPHRIGHALESAWGGKLSTHYDEAGYFVRVGWERDS